MFKSLLIFVFVTPTTFSCSNSQSKADCRTFKNGNFIYQSNIDYSYTKIERKDSLQIETNLQNGAITKEKVTWINDCEYDLKYISDNSVVKIAEFMKDKTLKNKIIKIEKDYYIFESSMVGQSRILIDTMRLENNKQ